MSDGAENVTACVIMLILGFLGWSIALNAWNLLSVVIGWYA